MNTVSNAVLLTLAASLLMGCATPHLVGYGTVAREMKIAKVDYTPKSTTDSGALTGGSVGAIAGASIGTAITVATFGLGAPLIPALAATGAATGAVAGGTTGYIYGVKKQGNGLFTYIVKPLSAKKNAANILIRQYEKKPIRVGSKVKIMKKGRTLYILPA